MNGRVYDATLGRFLSADPNVQAPANTQSLNRYTYVNNNPLSYTDPSGYFFKKLWKNTKKFVNKVTGTGAVWSYIKKHAWARMVVAAVASYFTFGAAAAFGIFAQGAAAGFVGGAIMTGTLKGAVRGAVFGGISAGLADYIGGADFKSFGAYKDLAKDVAHGVVQGGLSEAFGGDFKSGFVGSFAGHFAGRKIMGKLDIAGRTAVAAIVGGAAAKLGGGKFANGAVSAAFSHLFNNETWGEAPEGKANNVVEPPENIKAALEGQFGEGIGGIEVIENSTFARLHGENVLATTRENRIYLSVDAAKFFADPELMLHEYFHVIRQWNTGQLTVPKYLWENVTNGNGYWGNRYEVEARKYARDNLAAFRKRLKQ